MDGRVWAVVAVAASAWISGCTSVIDGDAVRAAGGPPPGQSPLQEGDLDEFLLSDDELNATLGSSSIEITEQFDEMTDDSDDISDTDCLGAVYTAEEPVYAGTGYTAVRTELAAEPGDDYEHWVEQTAVIVASADEAAKFLDESAQEWDDCAHSAVSVYDGEGWYDWELDDVVRGDGVISQMSSNSDFGDWQCQHAMGTVSNLVAEVSICSERITDEATTVVGEMIAKAG